MEAGRTAAAMSQVLQDRGSEAGGNVDAPMRVVGGDVRRRRVFYLSGFDPQGPGHYHRLYVEEAAKQARVSGASLQVGERRRLDAMASGWTVSLAVPCAAGDAGLSESTGSGEEVRTEYEFLRWDDIVRAHWPRSRWQVMVAALVTTAHQVFNGVLWRVLKTSWPAFLVLTLPPLLVVFLAAAAGVASGVGLWLVAAGIPWVAGAWGLLAGLAWWRFAGWAEVRVQMAWLMRSTRFILRQAAGEVPELDERLDRFGERIFEALASEAFDEVLVVGHSSGAMLAVSASARALARARTAGSPGVPPRTLSLLTLGECIPIFSYQPEAEAFRNELATVAGSSLVEWVDITAPPDGCCFALVDPAAAARRIPAHSGRGESPKLLSARFAQSFAPANYARIRRDKYRCHFQYLMATELPADYDYFAVTAGPARLAARFAEYRSVVGFKQFQTFGGPDS